MNNQLVYLDSNATTKVAPEVIEAMLPFFNERWGNPSSLHHFGGSISKEIEIAREKVAALIGAKRPKEIIFMSSGTESINAAIHSATKANPNKRHMITTKVEHPAVLQYMKNMEKNGYKVTYLGVDEKGMLNLDELKSSITGETLLVSVMWANNETGVIFPIDEISKICSEKKILFHTDAVQAVGKVGVNISSLNVDMLSLSGHKIYAPKGIGALYVKSGTIFFPYILGGHQEGGRRASTENVASIIGLGKAAEFSQRNLHMESTQVMGLRDLLEKKILGLVPNAHINGDRRDRLPNTTNIAFDGVEGEAILLMLDELKICVSTGSACSSESLEPSHVLTAMNVPERRKHGSIRFSLSIYNTQEEIEYAVESVAKVIARLRELSPIK